jgi:hypothetical protein
VASALDGYFGADAANAASDDSVKTDRGLVIEASLAPAEAPPLNQAID